MVCSPEATKFTNGLTSEVARFAIVMICTSESDSDSEFQGMREVFSCIFEIEYESQ